MKMPLAADHARRDASRLPVDVNGPTLIGTNDRRRGHATVLMLKGSDGASKNSWREGGFERHFIYSLKTMLKFSCYADVGGARSFISNLYPYERRKNTFSSIEVRNFYLLERVSRDVDAGHFDTSLLT